MYEHLRVWTSAHDNDSEAWIAETTDGQFVVWTCPAGADAAVEYVEETEEYAKAALFALQRHTGHRCGPDCGGWELSTSHPPPQAALSPVSASREGGESFVETQVRTSQMVFMLPRRDR